MSRITSQPSYRRYPLRALAGVAGYFTGELELGAAANVVITSLLALFLRHGISKTEKAVAGEAE